MAPKKVKRDSASGGRKLTCYSIEMKKEIIEKHERGVCVSDLASQYGMAKSTICTFLKHKETIKTADVAKGVFGKSNKRPQILEKSTCASNYYHPCKLKCIFYLVLFI